MFLEPLQQTLVCFHNLSDVNYALLPYDIASSSSYREIYVELSLPETRCSIGHGTKDIVAVNARVRILCVHMYI